MLPKDIHHFGTQLAQTSRAWRGKLDRRLHHLGLSQARWVVLLQVARSETPPTQRELAKRVSVEGPTLARLLDGLESQGLVERMPVEEDRRAKRIGLTDKSRSLITDIERIAADVRAEVLAGISEAEIQACQQLFSRIQSNLERAAE